MYTGSARYYDRIYAWKDYAAESAAVRDLALRLNPFAKTLLDVACGTGKHLEHLRSSYRVEGVDLDAQMLEIARDRLPGVELHPGDMADFDLGRTFDVVLCLFSSIAYARTTERLRRTAANLARHVAPKGVLLVEPWFTPDRYEWDRVYAQFVDDPDLKIARVNVSGPPANVSVLEFHYVVGTPEGVETFTERHEVGLFTHEDYLGALGDAGLDVHHDPEGLMGRGLYAGVKAR